jgi:2-iminobutanoate/2-iminopropanoate deaminase
MRAAITSPDAPPAIGPYSQAIRAGDHLWLSGQIALDPATGTLVGETAAEQAERCLANLAAVLHAAGATLAQVVRCTIYLADLNDFAAVNAVYARHMASPPPARATVEVARLPRDARVEIDAVAWLGGPTECAPA